MDEDQDCEERSVRRSKRLEDRQRKSSEDLTESKKGKKRKISKSPEQASYKLRRYLSPPSHQYSQPSTSTASSLGNTKSIESSPPNTSSSSKKKPETDAGSSAASSSMSAPLPNVQRSESDDNISSADDDIARLQNLLEARGVPPHLLTSFGSRMHLILNRSTTTMSHAQTLLQQLQSKQEPQQLEACIDLCQMLVMGNEETLAGFPARQSVPLLVQLLCAEDNMLLMHHACRALTYLMESLPRSAIFVVEAVPSLLLKLRSIQCMDVAEQALTALDMLSKKHAKNILQAGGVSACLCYIDFFSLNAQRSALNITANCCQVITPNDGHLFMESIPTLTSKLNTQDKRLLESCCLTFSRLVEQLKSSPNMIMEICNEGLVTNLQQLLFVGSSSVMSSNVFIMILRILATVFQHCTILATQFIKQDASGTIRSLLLGNKAPVELNTAPTLVHRSSNELYEILGLCAELLPQLPRYGVFSVDSMISGAEDDKNRQWFYKDIDGEWQQFPKTDNKIINSSCDAGETEVNLRLNGQSVTVDLSTMRLENDDTGETQDVASSRKKNFLPELLHSANKEKDKEDCRLALLKDEPALYAELCQTMLLLLSEVYRNSATPNVRYKCLHCQLRIIYHLRADRLRTITEVMPLSSTVAGMLSSQDSRLVIYGLQLSEILMKKLPSVFAVNFRREGVMHAVKKILTETSAVPGRSNVGTTESAPLSPTCSGSSTVGSKFRSFVGSPPKSIIFPPISALHNTEARTTRSRVKAGGEPSSTQPETLDSSFPKRLESAWRRRRRPPPLKKKSYKSKFSNSPSPPALPCPGPPTKEELQQWVQHQAGKFCQKYLSDDIDNHTTTSPLAILTNAVKQLSSCTDSRDSDLSLQHIKSLLVGRSDPVGTLSSFELLHAGLVETLLKFLTPQPSDRETDVLQRVTKLLEVFIYNENNDFDPDPFTTLFFKLQQCLSQLEHFPVKINDGLGDSLSKVMSTYQIKCLLRKHPDNSNTKVRQWGSGTVKVDPLAYVQALEKYLILRGYCREEEDSSSDVSEDEGDDRVISRQQTTVNRHKLTLYINNHTLPYDMTMYQAIKRYGTHTRLDDEAHPASHSAVWHNIHTIIYKSYENTDRSRTSTVKVEHEPPASSLLEKLSSAPPMVLESYQGIKIIQLLHILHTISQEWPALLRCVDDHNPIIKQEHLINQQIAAKVERQLQDPLVIMTSEYPKWFVPLPYYTPFLFSFEVRQQLLHGTAFDRDRALQRLHETHPELTINTENRTGIRLDKDKRCVDRSTVFIQGQGIMNELSSSRSLLEVYYVGEVGTGLGPTLEFYTLLCEAFQEAQHGMWRGPTVDVDVGGEMVAYTDPHFDLYPCALLQTDSPELEEICNKFNYLGRVIGKSLIDNRILDLPLSLPFHRWLLGTHEKMSLTNIKEIDPVLHSSLRQIEVFLLRKESIMNNDKLSEEEKSAEIEKITGPQGGSIDDLFLDFVLPGTDIELIPGGKNTVLTINNVGEYLSGVVNYTLREGVRKQMNALRDGFGTVMPLSNLQLFYASEMTELLCGNKDTSHWTEDDLAATLQPDHGYTTSSTAVKLLIQVLSGFNTVEQRAFLKFVTGSPRLPVGGFKSLHPRLTVVKKSVDGPPDTYLPSVMTCVNYLKLPDYTNAEILREKILTALHEGHDSFHLS